MTSSDTFPVVDYLRGTASNLESLIEGDPEDAPGIIVDADETSEVVAGLRAAADQVEKLQQQLAASDRVALGLQQRCATAEHALHALAGEVGLSHLMPLLEEAQRSRLLDIGRLSTVMPTVQRLAREHASAGAGIKGVPQ